MIICKNVYNFPGNAILNADTPVMDALMAANNVDIEAHGLHVGLPDKLMGNSEVGHQNIGAGRVVFQVSGGRGEICN